MKLDILVLSVHPDDAELGCGGTIAKHIAMGKKVGVIDLTRGELGTRGTAETRNVEAADAAKILGIHVRENLGMRDGFFENDEKHRLQVIEKIRQYKPEIIITNAYYDRHPDHGRASELVSDAVFLSGLKKIKTDIGSGDQEAWRPNLTLYFIQDYYIKPDIVTDITEFWDVKMDSVLAYKTQFYDPESIDPDHTYISSPEFLKIFEARAFEFGKYIGVKYAEGFLSKRLLGVDNLFNLR